MAQIIQFDAARRRKQDATHLDATYEDLAECTVDLLRMRQMIDQAQSHLFALCNAVEKMTMRKT